MEYAGGLLLILNQKNVFLFDSYGFKGFQVFILRDNKQVIDKILYNLKKKDAHIKKKDVCEKKKS